LSDFQRQTIDGPYWTTWAETKEGKALMSVAKGLQSSMAENMHFAILVKNELVRGMMTGWAKKYTML